MSDTTGRVIADGELTQELTGDQLRVKIRWAFADGREVEEGDEFRVNEILAQTRFSWVETRKGSVLRRLEADLSAGTARATTRNERGELQHEDSTLELPAGRAFTGYGTALAVSELSMGPGEKRQITFVAFTPKPRAVTLEVSRSGTERFTVAGRSMLTDRYTLHPAIPFPANLFVHARDAQLWFTHSPPPALVRAEQNLATKDDPVVVIDVTPRGPARPPSSVPQQQGSAASR